MKNSSVKMAFGQMRTLFLTCIIGISIITTSVNTVVAQCQPSIKIDGNATIVGQSDATSWVSLPLWLKEGQTLQVDQMVSSISVIEFTINGTSLEFSQVLAVTTLQTVPSGKVWKVESVARQRPLDLISDGITYTSPGVHSFNVPSCVSYLCVEVWGGGGGGAAGGNYNGGGGGGGGYGKECFSVTPGANYSVTVGVGGKNANGGTSSFGSLISATGGSGSLNSSTTGAAGGTSTAAISISGGAGTNGLSNNGGDGGQAGNGGRGGSGGNPGVQGNAPGGGGGGGGYNSSAGVFGGGGGAAGQVKISW